MSNFVTVTKDDATDWYEVKNQVQAFIREHLVAGGALLTEEITKEDHAVSDEDTDIEVKGRHDPCICPRVVPVVEAMIALTLVDSLMLQKSIID